MPGITVDASSLLKSSFSALGNVDYAKMFEIAKVVKEKNEISKFEGDPSGYSRAVNGFEPPPGFHMHIVDAKNNYHPAEADATSQLGAQQKAENWTRVEVRAGYEDIACIICLWCKPTRGPV